MSKKSILLIQKLCYTFRLLDNAGTQHCLRAGDNDLYFGSVRFFKNLIFLAVCVLILIPTFLAVKYYRISEQAAAATTAREITTEDTESLGDPGNMFEPDKPADSESTGSSAHSGIGTDGTPTADPPSYQSLYPDFYAPQPYTATERVENTIYLTFDDGPSDRTDEILAVLAEKNVKATFFVIGHSDQANLERMRKIVEAGHTIGMHSYSHDYGKVYASVESFLDEFHRNFVQIVETTGVTPTVFRFPGGSINGYDGGFYQEIISEMIRRGFVPYDWNVSSEDAVGARESVSGIVQHVVQGASGKVRGFVLFHDSAAKTTTSQAVGQVIDRLQAMGFAFAAITPDTMPVLYNYQY